MFSAFHFLFSYFVGIACHLSIHLRQRSALSTFLFCRFPCLRKIQHPTFAFTTILRLSSCAMCERRNLNTYIEHEHRTCKGELVHPRHGNNSEILFRKEILQISEFHLLPTSEPANESLRRFAASVRLPRRRQGTEAQKNRTTQQYK